MRIYVCVCVYMCVCVCVCVCVCERERKKINSFVNLLFKKDFKRAELLTKTSFFLYFRDHPKNGDGSKEDVESISTRVTKHVSEKVTKAEVNLNC